MRGILYVEGYTDIQILRAWAARLDHRAATLLATEIMWKPVVFQTREGAVGGGGVRAREHHEALQLVRNDFPGIELIDGDAHPIFRKAQLRPPACVASGGGVTKSRAISFTRMRWDALSRPWLDRKMPLPM